MRSNYDTDIFGLCWPQCMTCRRLWYPDVIGILKPIMEKSKRTKCWNMLELNHAQENVIGEAGVCKAGVADLHHSSCLIHSMAGEPYEGRVGADDVGMRDTAYRFSAAWRAWHLLGFAEGWVSLNQLVTPLCSKSTRNMSTWFGPSQAKPEELPCAVGLHLVASVFLKQETHMGV